MIVKDTLDNQTIFQIICFNDALDIGSLEVNEYNSLSIDVALKTIQTGRFPNDLVLSFPTRHSDTITLPSSSNTIQKQLYNAISVSCNKTPTVDQTVDQIFWIHTYENATGRVWGTLDNTDSQCGRHSLKNPTTIFRALASQDEITQTIKDEVPWEIYNWVKQL